MTHHSGYRIPFNRPTRTARDLSYLEEALARGRFSGDGPFTERCHEILARAHRAPRALLTTSCTHALEMAALLLNIGPGDEVIVPSFTFVSSANAFAVRGATPVFADIDPVTLGLDHRLLPALITSRTKAIVVVHYAGVGCQMDAIIDAAGEVPIIEDNAHGLFGAFRGQALGTFGPLSTLSFHETKNFTCGEGGGLVINDPSLIERAEIIREKGTDRMKFHRGEVRKYEWIDLGSSYLPSELLAAMLCAQLEDREAIQARRRALWHAYQAGLGPWASANDVALPAVPADRDQPYHMFYLLTPTEAFRDRLAAHLKADGILAVSHYVPLHSSPAGRRLGGAATACPVTDHAATHLLRLPFFTAMSDVEQAEVMRLVQECRL